jgi:hypothetical protein
LALEDGDYLFEAKGITAGARGEENLLQSDMIWRMQDMLLLSWERKVVLKIMRLLVMEVQQILLEVSRMNSSSEVKQRCS